MRWGTLTVLFVWLAALPQAHAKDIEIEVAWDAGAGTNELAKGAKGLSKATKGRVSVKFAVVTDDATAVQNMVAGEAEGALLTSAGLAMIAPELRLLDLPFLFPDTQAADAGRAVLADHLGKSLEAAGYVLVGWTDMGGIHLFSASEIKTAADLRQSKMGAPIGDPLMQTYLANLGVTSLPVARADVRKKLADGVIDTWHAATAQLIGDMLQGSVKYQSSKPLWVATGAIVIRKDVYDALEGVDQTTLTHALEASAEYFTAEIRRVEKSARKALAKQANVTSVDLPQELVADLKAAAVKTWKAHAGTDYDVAVLNSVLKKQGLTQVDPAKVPARTAALKPAAARASAAIQQAAYRGDGTEEALSTALADAPEDLRALRLALEDCDADMMAEWIVFPVRIGAVRYRSAGELSKACVAGESPQLPAAELEAGLRNATLSGTDLRLRVASQDWRFVWNGRQWWLAEVVSHTSY